MGREKRLQPGHATAKDRHKRAGKINKAIDRSEPLPPGLVAAKPVQPITNSKHQSYFEFIENKDKKKQLLFEYTADRQPPPGMTYIPMGNPELTEKCKEISREEGASVYIVTFAKKEASELSQQIHRVGVHVREYIVERAMRELGLQTYHKPQTVGSNGVEEIPRSQVEINKQADAALRELFPRIPNTDRQQIIDHAFKKGKQFNGELVVGLQQELSLSRRVQLAVLAHIRHNHTRYDQLLRETTWANARRVTEQLCLDILVKWRGDDENGRNQLDEILREVVVLSDDSEGDDSGDEPDSDSSAVLTDRSANAARVSAPAGQREPHDGNRVSTAVPSRPGSPKPLPTPVRPKKLSKKLTKKQRRKAKHQERGFDRYAAQRTDRWDEARRRQHQAQNNQLNQPAVGDHSVSHGMYSQGQPVLRMEGRAPVRDVDAPQAQIRPGFGHFTGEDFHVSRPFGGHSAAPLSMGSNYLSSGPATQKVNEPGSAQDSRGCVSDGPHQLQDLLHPSIEPRSPDGSRLPSRFGRPAEYADITGGTPPHGLQSASRRPVVRETDRILPRQFRQAFPTNTRSFADGPDMSRAPVVYHHVPQDATWSSAHQMSQQSDPFLRRSDDVSGERANPIMVEDYRPGTIVLGPGESVRDRFGPGAEIVSAVRRPSRLTGSAYGRQHVPSQDEGFIRLRENVFPEQRDGLREEGFLRIREHPDTLHSVSRPNDTATSEEFRPRLGSHRYQAGEAPDQAVYVRRIERLPSADVTYMDPGSRRVERVRAERLEQRNFSSPGFGGGHIEQFPRHQERVTYGVPVHRQARPTVRAEGSPRFTVYPPTPPRQRQWPPVNDDIIVIE